jgi:serine protease Do
MTKLSSTKTGAVLAILVTLASFATSASAKITTDSLKVTESRVKSAVERALPCTVGLVSNRTGAAGSGVIVSEDGLILTAGHVTQAAGDDLFVFLPNGRRLRGKALGANYSRDASMVRILDPGTYPHVDLGDSESLKMDQWCISLGHAGGFQRDRSAPIRLGRVLGRNLVGFLSTDCTLIGGDSGGPLFDLDGKLIGIHSNIGATLSENHHVPISVFENDWDRLASGERWGHLLGARMPENKERPVLGVLPKEAVDGGVRVDVIAGAAAAKAGLRDGDVIQAVGGKKTPDTPALQAAIAALRVGKSAEVSVRRGDEQLKIKVRLMRARDIEQAAPSNPEEPSANDPDAAPDDADADQAAVETSEAVQDPDKLFRDLVEQAQREKRSLEMTPETMEQLGGMEQFTRRLREVSKQLEPQELARLMGIRLGEDTFFMEVLDAYRPIVAAASDSVYPLFKDKQQVALATVVGSDGLLLTKASEVEGGNIEMEIRGKRLPTELLQKFPTYDLALLKVNAKLTPITWHDGQEGLALGTFLTAVGPEDTPLAVGLLSVSQRSLSPKDKPFLGVALGVTDEGLRISGVVADTAADQAGLRVGDVIVALDGKQYPNVEDFVDALQTKRPGDKVRLDYLRDGERSSMDVALGDRSSMRENPLLGMYPQGGQLSDNRDGYPNALQTDLPIEPRQCGGPIVGLDGRALGVNIARAGRIKSYAIPADVIRELLKDVITADDTVGLPRKNPADSPGPTLSVAP